MDFDEMDDAAPRDFGGLIEDVISTADSAIATLTELSDAILAYKLALMEHLLSLGLGHDAMKSSPAGEIPAHWRVVRLDDVLDPGGKFISAAPVHASKEHAAPDGVCLIAPESLAELRLNDNLCARISRDSAAGLQAHAARGCDIVMALTGEAAGACAIIPPFHEGGITGAGCVTMRVDLSLCDPFYLNNVLHYYYRTGVLYSLSGGSDAVELDVELLKKLMIKLPPLDEQKKIAHILLSVSGEMVAAEQAAQAVLGVKRNFAAAADE